MSARPNGCNQNAENIDGDDVGVPKAGGKEDTADQRGQYNDQQGFEQIRPAEPRLVVMGQHRFLFIQRLRVGDDVYIHIFGKLRQLVGQAFSSEQQVLTMVGAPEHDFRHAADFGVFRNLHRRILAVDGGYLSAHLFGEPQVVPQPFQVFTFQLPGFRRFHEQGREAAVKRLRHARGRPDHFGIGR